MPKSLVLGNGNILIGMDKYGQVNDFYYPHVGLEEQIGKHLHHKIGIWVDNNFSWISDGNWQVNLTYQHESLGSKIEAFNHNLKIKLEFCDIVYNESDIFLREVKLYNLDSTQRIIKIFFHQNFEIAESYRADTAYFDPISHTIIHYKGRRVFLINAISDFDSFDDFSIGNYQTYGNEGTYKDAEDGILSKNPIEHGMVDSVLGFGFDLATEESKTIYYWICASRNIKDAKDLNSYLIKKTPQHLIRTTIDFWKAWVNKQQFNFCNIDEPIIQLFKKNLLIIKTHIDHHGAIIASGDSDMLQHGKDNYSYMWPRDGALVAQALDNIGDSNASLRFFQFCNNVITDEGYFMHKYSEDQSLGSSWHPWFKDGNLELPIQEDGIALVIISLYQHFEFTKDLEFVESIYNSLIKKAADFMVSYRDEATGLPKPSYDLWEEKFGIHTFTAASIFGALKAASNFAQMLGKEKDTQGYQAVAEQVKLSILNYLYDQKNGYFYKMLSFKKDKGEIDKTLDVSSAYGIYKFSVLEPNDERLSKAMNVTYDRLWVRSGIGGLIRYEHDQYFKGGDNSNPWFITTLWFAQYLIAKSKEVEGLKKAYEILEWTLRYSNPAGIISEQLDPKTGAQLSAAPLTWSSAELVMTILQYLKRLKDFGICEDIILKE